MCDTALMESVIQFGKVAIMKVEVSIPVDPHNKSWSIKKLLKFIHTPHILHALTTKSGLSAIDFEDELWQTHKRPYLT